LISLLHFSKVKNEGLLWTNSWCFIFWWGFTTIIICITCFGLTFQLLSLTFQMISNVTTIEVR